MFHKLKQKIKAVIRQQSQVKLEDWFYYWLREQHCGGRRNYLPRNNYYEFGVGWGDTMCEYAKAAIRIAKETDVKLADLKIFGFDSFAGLPPKVEPADDHPRWRRGDFAHPEEHTLNRLRQLGFPVENVTFVKGFFEDTLTEAMRNQLRHCPPAIVTLDVDYCSSTRTALEFLAPILESGTVFYFDDLHSFHLHPEMGQLKAINEFNGQLGYLSPLREFDFRGKTFMFATQHWEAPGEES